MSRRLFRNPAVRQAQFYRYSADGAVLGKLAAHVARIVAGKHKPVYNPAVDCGDNVVITDCEKVVLTGKKLYQKHYRWHTGFVGHLEVRPLRRVLEETPERVLWKAVYGMLPKNRLRPLRMQRLRLFRGEQHAHESQTIDPPPHLEFKRGTSKKARAKVASPDELADVPGYWMEFESDESGTTVRSYMQAPNGKLPPKRTKKAGLYKRGDSKHESIDIKPMEEIPMLRDVAGLTNKEVTPTGKGKQ